MELHAGKIIAKRTVGEFAGGIADKERIFPEMQAGQVLGQLLCGYSTGATCHSTCYDRHAEQRRFSKHGRGFVSQITCATRSSGKDKATV